MFLVIGIDEVFHNKGHKVVKLWILVIAGFACGLKAIDVFPRLCIDKAKLVWTDTHNGAILAV